MTSAVEVLMGVSSFLGLGFLFITNNPDTPALQLLHNNSYATGWMKKLKWTCHCPGWPSYCMANNRLILWLTLQIAIQKMSRANTTWTTSALTATCAARRRRTILNATTTVGTRSSINNRHRRRKKGVARKPRRAARLKPLAITGLSSRSHRGGNAGVHRQ